MANQSINTVVISNHGTYRVRLHVLPLELAKLAQVRELLLKVPNKLIFILTDHLIQFLLNMAQLRTCRTTFRLLKFELQLGVIEINIHVIDWLLKGKCKQICHYKNAKRSGCLISGSRWEKSLYFLKDTLKLNMHSKVYIPIFK